MKTPSQFASTQSRFPISSTRPVRQALLIMATLWLANAVYAGTPATNDEYYVSAPYANWPTSWAAITEANDPNDGLAKAQMDFVGDSSDPGGYWSYNNDYVFFRIRVHTNTVALAGWTGTTFVMIDRVGWGNTSAPDYAFAYDGKSNQPANHGLEMMTNSVVGATWSVTTMDDIDGNSGIKGTNDINGNSRTADGYVRTITEQVTSNFGNTTFMDIAVSWTYLQTYTQLGRGQTWRITFASVDANDHTAPTADVAGGATPSSAPSVGWSGDLTITATAVRDMVVGVERDDTGNQVKWRTGHEVSNLGFNIHRVGPQGWKQLNPSLIAGSALIAGAESTLTAGNSYSWWDPDGDKGDSYCVESVDLNGKREMHGPARSSAAVRAGGGKKSSPLLNRVPPNAYTVRSNHSKPSRRAYDGRKMGAMLRSLKPTAPQQTQWDIASRDGVKIGVRADGWYVISQSDLLAAGLSPNANPELLQLHVDGVEQPLLLQGRRGKTFESIAFYGTGLDTPATDTRVYWLAEGRDKGLRIQMDPVRMAKGDSPASFPYTIARSDKLFYVAALHNGDDADNFFGPVIGSAPAIQTLTVHHAVRGGITPTLQVNVQGVTSGAHTVNVLFNGVNAGTLSFSGQDEGQRRFTLSPAALKEGDNTITLTSGGGLDISLVDTVSLTYAHSFAMDGAVQRFTAPAGPVAITSSSSSVEFYDVTDPADVRRLKAVASAAGSGEASYAYRLFAGGRTERAILAVQTPDGIQKPAWITANQPSRWHEASNGAQMVIISHSTLLDSARRLAAFRISQGLSVAVVNVEDVYDEFNFGAKDPAALRRLLQRASSNWKTAPRYVLLMGDATFDPRDYLGLGGDRYDLVPTKDIDTAYVKTASDDWFGDFNGTGVPVMAFGRLPARSPIDADLMVSKIIGYEQSARPDFWRRQILFVADHDNQYDFQSEVANLAALVPPPLVAASVLRGATSDVESASQIASAINQGVLVVNYMGHGSMETWRGNLLTSDTALALNNGPRLPFFVNMTCLNGRFHDLFTDPFGEALMLAPNGGAVGVWASSSLTDPFPQAVMNRALLEALFAKPTPTVGEAILKAKAAVNNNDVRRTWILLGDPTSRIR